MTAKSFFAFLLRRMKDARRALAPSSSAATPAAELGQKDTFCVLAFNHLQIAPNGTVKMCCISGEDIADGDRAMSLYSDTYEDIWNSKYMRDARRGMDMAEEISACARCYREEASVGQSRRTVQNAVWLEANGKTAEEFLKDARANEGGPISNPNSCSSTWAIYATSLAACAPANSPPGSRVILFTTNGCHPFTLTWRDGGAIIYTLLLGPISASAIRAFTITKAPALAACVGRMERAIPPGAGVCAIGIAIRGRYFFVHSYEWIGAVSRQNFRRMEGALRTSWLSSTLRNLCRVAKRFRESFHEGGWNFYTVRWMPRH
jgi:Iron-sulfur cluster-binding domain